MRIDRGTVVRDDNGTPLAVAAVDFDLNWGDYPKPVYWRDTSGQPFNSGSPCPNGFMKAVTVMLRNADDKARWAEWSKDVAE